MEKNLHQSGIIKIERGSKKLKCSNLPVSIFSDSTPLGVPIKGGGGAAAPPQLKKRSSFHTNLTKL